MKKLKGLVSNVIAPGPEYVGNLTKRYFQPIRVEILIHSKDEKERREQMEFLTKARRGYNSSGSQIALELTFEQEPISHDEMIKRFREGNLDES